MDLTYLVLTKSYEVGSTKNNAPSRPPPPNNHHGVDFIASKIALFFKI